MHKLVLLRTILLVCLVVVLYEHTARIQKWRFQIAPFLYDLAEWLCGKFVWIGQKIAWISSFYVYLCLDQLYDTAYALAGSCLYILVSPFATAVGYFDFLLKVNRPSLIIIGSMTLGLILLYVLKLVLKRYYPNISFKDMWYCECPKKKSKVEPEEEMDNLYRKVMASEKRTPRAAYPRRPIRKETVDDVPEEMK